MNKVHSKPLRSRGKHVLTIVQRDVLSRLSLSVPNSESPKASQDNAVRIGNIVIKQDAEGRYCLNDVHRAGGANPNKRPSDWLKSDGTQRFVQELGKGGILPLVSVKGGATPGTYATKLAVFKYAGWISPEFEVHVYNTFDKVVTGQYRPVSPEETNERLALAVLEEVKLRKGSGWGITKPSPAHTQL